MQTRNFHAAAAYDLIFLSINRSALVTFALIENGRGPYKSRSAEVSQRSLAFIENVAHRAAQFLPLF